MGLFSRKPKPARPRGAMIVVAAGAARRMNGIDKILQEVAGLPVIVHTLMAMEQSEWVDEVVVCARTEDIWTIGDLCKRFGLGKVTKIVRGGDDRVQSSLAGLSEISPNATVVGVHDGARPCASPRLIDSVMAAAAQFGAAIPGVSPVDTVKEVDEQNCVARTLKRDTLVSVQTPQCFERAIIQGALARAVREAWLITDDSAAVERMGMRVHIVEGELANIKITRPDDLPLVEKILMGGMDSEDRARV